MTGVIPWESRGGVSPYGGTFDPTYMTPERAYDLQNRIKFLTTVNPTLASDPVALKTIAEHPGPIDQVGKMASSLYAMQSTDQLRARLVLQPPDQQRIVWSQLTDDQRKSLEQLGYDGPDEPAGRGMFAPLEWAGSAVGFGLNVANEVINAPVIKQGLDALTWIGDQPARLYRTIRILPTERQLMALAAGAAAVAGVAAAPFTGGASLGLTGLILGGSALLGASAGAAVLNPSDWYRAWQQAENGERTFSVTAQARARGLLLDDPRLTGLAADLAENVDLYELAEEFAGVRQATDLPVYTNSIIRIADDMLDKGDPRYEELVGKLHDLARQPSFREAVETLQAGKLSFGRDMAQLLQLKPGSTGHTLLSGGLDAAWILTMDPTLVLGKLFAWNRARRLVFPIVEGPSTLIDSIDAAQKMARANPRIGQAYRQLVDRVNAGDLYGAMKVSPHTQGLVKPLWDEKRRLASLGRDFTEDSVFDWMRTADGAKTMLSGQGVKRGHAQLLLPTVGARIGNVYIPTDKLRRGASEVIDFTNDLHVRRTMKKVQANLEQAAKVAEDEMAKLGGGRAGALVERDDLVKMEDYRALRWLIGALDTVTLGTTSQVGHLAYKLTHQVPMSMGVALEGGDAAIEIKRWADLIPTAGLTSDLRDAWFNTILKQPSVAQRADGLVGLMDTLITANGGRSIKEWDELSTRYVNHVRHAYSSGPGNSLTLENGEIRRRGLVPSDRSLEIGLPDFRALHRAAKKGLLFKHVYRVVDSPLLSTMMNDVWKPAVLLRVGFIPRAAGEELLSFLARNGFSALLTGHAARSIARGKVYDDLLDELQLLTKVDEGRVTLAQRRQLNEMRYVSHIRPLQWAFGSHRYLKDGPMLDWMVSYSNWVRRNLEQGFLGEGAKKFVANVPDKWRPLLTGPPTSMRSLIVNGVEPETVKAAREFYTEVGDTLMRDITAQSAGHTATNLTHDPPPERTTTDMDPRTGEMTQFKWRVDRGGHQEYLLEDNHPMLDSVGWSHYRKYMHDPVIGPAVQDAYLGLHPWSKDKVISEGGTTFEQWLGDLDSLTNSLGKKYQQIVYELLSPTDHHLPELAKYFRPGTAERKLLDSVTPGEDVDVAAFVRKFRTWFKGDTAYIRAKVDKVFLPDGARASWMDDDRLRGIHHWTAARGQRQMLWAERGRLPEFANADEMWAWLENRMVQLSMDPKNQRIVSQMDYAFRIANGDQVANGLDEKVQRVYTAAVSPDVIRYMAARRGELYAMDTAQQEALVGLMWDLVDDPTRSPLNRAEREIMHDLGPEVISHFVHDALNLPTQKWASILQTQAVMNGSKVIPISGMAFNNPDTARAFGKLLSRAHLPFMEDLGHLGYITSFDDLFAIGKPTETGIRRARKWKGGHSTWITDPELTTPNTFVVDNRGVTRTVDGELVEGVSLEDALRSNAQLVNRQLQELWLEQESRVYRAQEQMWTNPDARGDPVQPGTRISKTQTYYDADGNELDLRDINRFTAETRHVDNAQLQHEMLAPMARDSMEQANRWTMYYGDDESVAGTVRGSHAEDLEGEISEMRLEQPVGKAVYRSHREDWRRMKNKPQVVVGPIITRVEPEQFFRRAINRGFDSISAAIDAVVRRPLAFHFYAEARAQNLRAMPWLDDPKLFVERFDEIGRRLGYRPEVAQPEVNRMFEYLEGYLTDDDWWQYTKRWDPDDPDMNLGAYHKQWARMQDHERNSLFHAHQMRKANEKTITQLSTNRAIMNSIQYIDSHEIRSQFGEVVKAFSPFWYAEENFIKRWARTLSVAPEALRKGQLLYAGLKSGGVIRTDARGTDWFVYPGAGFVAEVMGKVPGVGNVLPAGAVFATEPRFMLPGFNPDQTGIPQAGPLVTMPLQALTGVFPELQELNRKALGDTGSNRPAYLQFVPSVFRNLWESLLGDPESSTRYASAMNSAAQVLEANGKGLPDGATTDEVDEYMRRLEDSTRTILLMQTLTNFVVPGPSQPQFTGESSTGLAQITGVAVRNEPSALRADFIELVRRVGVEEATQIFIGQNSEGGLRKIVDPLAYATSQSESKSGAPIPATEEALQFYDDHKRWFDEHSDAGAWVLPDDEGNEYSQYAYNRQVVAGLKDRRSPEDFVRTMKFKEGATIYFATKEMYETQIAEAASNYQWQLKRTLETQWEDFRSRYIAQHPVFADRLSSSEARQRRLDNISELRDIVNDPATPRTKKIDQMRMLAEAFDTYSAEKNRLAVSRAAQNVLQIERLQYEFQLWVQDLLVRNPELQALWTSVYRPEAELE